MGTRRITCSGLGSGSPPHERDVPTEDIYPHMTTQGVQVLVSLEAYERLVNWASMGRTLRGVIGAIDEVLFSEAQDGTILSEDLIAKLDEAREELETVRPALDECHQAVRRHWGNLK